jgi:hypothetical protein
MPRMHELIVMQCFCDAVMLWCSDAVKTDYRCHGFTDNISIATNLSAGADARINCDAVPESLRSRISLPARLNVVRAGAQDAVKIDYRSQNTVFFFLCHECTNKS